MTDLQKQLFALQDASYREFHARLMPTVERGRIIGIRAPRLRAFAKELADPAVFMTALPHFYYEENNLHAFLINDIKDFNDCLEATEAFLPYVDNWATCDGLRPKASAQNTARLLPPIQRWLASEHPFTVRFGMEMLMCHYLEKQFDPIYLEWVASVCSEDYYVKMMKAWYFATALAKQYEAALPYITERRLEPWVHQKTVQKACESDRITQNQKEFLKKHRKF